VLPVITYASEIWGIKQPAKTGKSGVHSLQQTYKNCKTEVLNLLMCRYFLGTHNRSCTLAVYGETGALPVYFEHIINGARYLNRLNEGNCNALLLETFECNKLLYDEGQNCWLSNIMQHLSLVNILPNSGKVNIKFLRKKLQKDFATYWKKELNVSTQSENPSLKGKLRTYAKFKETNQVEPYLNCLQISLRKDMARFRISAHNLSIETGRHQNIPVKDRICKLCDMNCVEDEMHFLVECTCYSHERQLLYDNAQVASANFSLLTEENKFLWLMTNENRDVIYALATYINNCFTKRNFILKTKCIM